MIQYRSIQEAADYIINLLKEFTGVNTIYIATNDGVTNTILKAFNRQEHLVEEGTCLPLLQDYCSLVFEGDSNPFIIPDTSLHPAASKMAITAKLGPCFFIGVPIVTSDNDSFGTLCVMDRTDISFSEKEISLLGAMAALIGYGIDLDNISNTDSLTGLYNRKFLEKVYDKSRSAVTEHPLTLLFIDLDNFKMVNDLYGHAIGDQVLLEVANRLKKQLRKTDKIVRLDGDEFLLIIEHPLTDQGRKRIVEKILSSFDEPVSLGHQMIQVSISVGISSSRETSLSTDILIEKADTALDLPLIFL
jgi:diguanylate cyclase (GGDEF)-like protein